MTSKLLKNIFLFFKISIFLFGITNCEKQFEYPPDEINDPPPVNNHQLITYRDSLDYPGIQKSGIYEVKAGQGEKQENLIVFQNLCPAFQLGYMDMIANDRFPLDIFKGRSINWVNFSFSGSVTIEIKILDEVKVPFSSNVKVLPSRYEIIPEINGKTIKFTITEPGQFSIEIGSDGYKHGLMIFANPLETEIPSIDSENYKVLDQDSDINSISGSYSGVYFKSGVHDIGVYHVPPHIKNIYIEGGAWVYGAIIMNSRPDVKIFGRGVLSAGRLNYRESHTIEAIFQSNNIHVEGIVIEDSKHFAVRLIGMNNTVKWVKTIGGWTYNLDGIAAFAGSDVSHCFIWANDDAIKVYRDNITWSDIVVWQLNNGGVIQMSWGGSVSTNVRLSRIDVLRAEWNKPGFNRSMLNCVGNRYLTPDRYGIQKDWLIEDVVTETPIPCIFGITPNEFTPNHIHNLTLKNWNVKMIMNTNFVNQIIGNDPDRYFDGFVFDNVVFNGIKLTESNWLEVTGLVVDRLDMPVFR